MIVFSILKKLKKFQSLMHGKISFLATIREYGANLDYARKGILDGKSHPQLRLWMVGYHYDGSQIFR